MIFKQLFFVAILSATLSATACNVTSAVQVNKPNTYKLTGQTQFPSPLRIQNTSISHLSQRATVSLLYPPGHAQQHQSITAGTTNEQGQFTLNPQLNFTPAPNSLYLLEAVKRHNGPQSELLALSTYVRWTGTSWESVTRPELELTTLTTTLTLISSLNPQLSASETLNSVQAGLASAVGSITLNTLNQVQALVNSIFNQGYDPTHYLRYNATQNHYSVIRPTNLPARAVQQLSYCPNCELQQAQLAGINASNANLRYANLTQANLSQANLNGADLTGANLTQADLSGATWINGQICQSGSIGGCQ